MIKLIESVIHNNLSYFPQVKDSRLSFLKYNTSSTHGSLDGKVLFFVFLEGAKQPIFVVKTIRTYESKYVVENAYNRLVKLQTLVKGSVYEKMFPKPLYVYDDGREFVFSIETYIDGIAVKNSKKVIESFSKEYSNFNKSIYKHEFFDSFYVYAQDLVQKIGLNEKEENVLMGYVKKLAVTDFKVARLPQHGDLTLDNILLENNEFRIIDCDSFGTVELAGYDMYRLVVRSDHAKLFSSLDLYFKRLGLKMKASKALLFMYYLHDLVYKKNYILKNKGVNDIVFDFEALIEQSSLRILHITRMNYFSNKSHVYTTSKTVEAMNGVDGTRCFLVSTDDSLLEESKKMTFLKSLNLSNFQVRSLSSLGKFTKNSSLRVFNWLETFFSNIRMAFFVVSQRKNFDVLYFRDSTLFLPIMITKYIFRKPIFMESHAVLHAVLKRNLTEFIAKRSDGIISISAGLKEYNDKINKKGIVSFCSASDPVQFKDIVSSQIYLRNKYGLPQDNIILGYVGNLSFTGNHDSYGFEDVIQALPLLDQKIILVGVGEKNNTETKHLRDLALKIGVSERVIFLPRVPKHEVASYLKAFDVLIHPKAGAQIGNSPAKLFEWLLSGRPIVAAHTGAIAEILFNDINALLVEYKDPESWKNAIEKILNDKLVANGLVKGALLSAKNYTWEDRGRTITDFIRTTLLNHE